MLQELLLNYSPSDSREITYKREMLDFMQAHEDCFERTCHVGHFTASCFLVNKHNSKFLLMLHRKLDKWLQLGGHCDGDSDILRVAIKEATEESGIKDIEPISSDIFDIDVHAIPKIGDVAEHTHYDVRFLLRVTSDEDFTINHESKALAWFGPDPNSLPECGDSILRMQKKWQQML